LRRAGNSVFALERLILLYIVLIYCHFSTISSVISEASRLLLATARQDVRPQALTAVVLPRLVPRLLQVHVGTLVHLLLNLVILDS